MFEWIGLGALMFALLLFSARVMRRGLTTLDQDREQYLERIAAGERQLAEDRKGISAQEQLYMMRAALADLLRLDGRDGEVEARGQVLELAGLGWQVELVMRERLLASTHRVIHGQSRWILRGFGIYEEYREPAMLMARLSARLRGQETADPEPDFIARRIAGGRRSAVAKKIICF